MSAHTVVRSETASARGLDISAVGAQNVASDGDRRLATTHDPVRHVVDAVSSETKTSVVFLARPFVGSVKPSVWAAVLVVVGANGTVDI